MKKTFIMILFAKIANKISLSVMLFLLISLAVSAQKIKIEGIVIDSNNAALAAATVQISGKNEATLTNEEGKFILHTSSKFPLTLTVEMIGYTAKSIVVNANEFITIQLQEVTNELGEILISSGYLTQKKSEFSGSVSTVSAKQLQNRPATSFDQLLGGQGTGIDVIQSSAVLNNTPVIRVRGLNTITSGLFPLIVIDGVAVFTGSLGGFVGNNPLSAINPNDIQSIDVLKDASAAAIYGSRAANG
ncbi:hypothetical protein EKL98_15955, partial [Flavobacterium bomense]